MTMASHSSPVDTTWISNTTARSILTYAHYACPIILLVFFLVATTAFGVLTASQEELVRASPDQTGPGGRPLPRNTSPGAKKPRQQLTDFSPARKILFIWISVAAILTFVGNSVVVITHAITNKADQWWCGQAVVVGYQTLLS